MELIVQLLKFIVATLLGIIYYPLNLFFLWFQKHYFKWKMNDSISFYAATPLYYLLFVIVVIISYPCEKLGESLH